MSPEKFLENKPPEFPISPDQFRILLPAICSQETSSDPDNWSEDNPLYGHCAVASLVAQSLYGGKLLRASMRPFPEFAFMRSHYSNQLSNGMQMDFTLPQFQGREPEGMVYEERARSYVLSFPETRERFGVLSLRFAKEVTKNPLFDDAIYRECFKIALLSPCQKMHFGAVLVKDGVIVGRGSNTTIPELASFCDPTCIRFSIESRTESMIGACGHAEEWALKDARDKGIDLKDCDMYVAGVNMNGMPWFKERNEATCLRCAVQINYAGVKSIQSAVVNRWEGITPSRALQTAKAYATGEKRV